MQDGLREQEYRRVQRLQGYEQGSAYKEYMESILSLVFHAVDTRQRECNTDESDRESYIDPIDETFGKEDSCFSSQCVLDSFIPL